MTSIEAAPALVRPGNRDAQRVFRAVLDALARPGTTTHLPAPAGVPAALVPLLALADLDTPVCVLDATSADSAQWLRAVMTATSAPGAVLGEARLVAALRPITADELRAVRVGTPADPEEAALVALAVPALTGGPVVRLEGPGVAPGAVIAPAGLPVGWLDVRAAVAYPAGADLLLVDSDGACVGLPRSTRTNEGS
ncbi:phosphonate C-P lyase system protein PhnH [Pseudonocardia sp. CA-142604]|uniref:phosphonate C-P lyase system protein PhnH n=1 Tax=Pseudonocardia sp. CA-142604 TaxID=3240024 RepID=UPI003D8ED85B